MAAIATDLPSTVEESLTACPKFRILVVGNTGVGKSSLISNVFNISLQDIDIAHNRAGKADVEFAYTSDENPRFILHDSQGFEPGETSNWDIVEQFLRGRSATIEFKDRIHAIWLCIETPRTGAREEQVGDEKLISLAVELKIPTIIVFTKFDILVNEHSRKAQKSKVPKSQILEVSLKGAEEDFKIRIKSWSEKPVSCTRISTKPKYLETLRDLAEITFQSLGGAEAEPLLLPAASQQTSVDHESVPPKEGQQTSAHQEIEEPLLPLVVGQQTTAHQEPETLLLLWVTVQQVNAHQKVEESIRAVKGQYWTNLGQSTIFGGRRLIECLSRIGQDILKVWNISDPNKLLSKIEFFAQIIKLLEGFSPGLKADLGQKGGPSQDPDMALLVRTKGSAFAQVLEFLFWPYRAIPATAQYLGAYIMDLTLVLRRIFMATLALTPRRLVSQGLIDEELQKYSDQQAAWVHNRVRDISVGAAGFERSIGDLIRQSLRENRADVN